MSGHIRPITCCDRECALVNGCRIGGVRCGKCGKWCCASDLDERGMCEDCDGEEDGE